MNDQSHDFTPGGMRVEGPYENDRNSKNSQLFKDIVRRAFGAGDVIIAHHITYVAVEQRDGFDYQIVQEIPSADTLIFDHVAASRIWGAGYPAILQQLALLSVPERDTRLAQLYYGKYPQEKQ